MMVVVKTKLEPRAVRIPVVRIPVVRIPVVRIDVLLPNPLPIRLPHSLFLPWFIFLKRSRELGRHNQDPDPVSQ